MRSREIQLIKFEKMLATILRIHTLTHYSNIRAVVKGAGE